MFRSVDISNITALGSKLSLVTLTESFADGSVLSVITGTFDSAADLANFVRQSNSAQLFDQVNSTTSLNRASFSILPDQTGILNRGLSESSTASIISSALLTLLSPEYMILRSGSFHFSLSKILIFATIFIA